MDENEKRIEYWHDTFPGKAKSAIRHSPEVDKILPAMLAAQKAIDHVGRDATAQVKTKGDKPDYSYGYTTLAHTLDAIKGHLNENGIVVVQGVQSEPYEYQYYDKRVLGMLVTVTTGLYDVSGQWFETSLLMLAKDTTPQTVGSCVTYGRRYTAMPLTCLASADDDGAAASVPLPPPKQKKTGTKKQDTKEADENEAVRKAEAAFHAEWDRAMEAIGEDDADASKALRHHFVKLTTEGSSGFVVMTDSTGGMSSKEIRLLTAMLKKGHDKVVGHCTGDWREAVGLPALGTVPCEICNAVLTEAEKSSCALVQLPGYYCTKHVPDGLKKKQEDSDEA